MGKGARSRANNAEKKTEVMIREQAQKKKKRAERVVTILIVAVLVLGIVAMAAVNAYRNSGIEQRKQIVMSTENFDVNGSMMSYLIYNQYANFVISYGDYVSYYGLNTSKDLKEQYTTDENNKTITWYDYFAKGAQDNVTQWLVLAEAAVENNVALTEAEEDAIAYRAKAIAKNSFLGRGVKEQDVLECMKLSQLASKYQLTLRDGMTPTAQEINDYYAKNPQDAQLVDYYSYTFAYEVPEKDQTLAEEKVSLDEAQALVATVKTAKTEAEFKQKLQDYLNSITAEGQTAKKAEDYKKTAATYTSVDEEVAKWLFNKDTLVNDFKVVHDEKSHYLTVYMLTAAPYLNEKATVSIRHLLIQAQDGSVTKEAARKQAEKLYEQWQKGDKTEESFAELAMKYTDDSNYGAGGIYTGVYEGQMVTTFNDWCFDKARKAGDTGIVDTDYGSHIMYFVGSDLPVWQTTIRDLIIEDEYTEQYKKLEEAHKVLVDQDIINALEVQ